MSQLLALVKMFNDEHSFYIDDLPEAAAKTDKALLNLVETKVYGIEQVESVEVYRAELVRIWSNPNPETED